MENFSAIHDHLVASNWLTDVREVRFLAAGEYNANYHVRAGSGEYVLRVNHGSQLGLGSGQIEYEFAVLTAVAPSGVTPRPYQVDPRPELLPGGALLMEYLPGRPLDYARDLTAAARIFARVHALPPGQGLLRQEKAVLDIASESEGLLNRFPDHSMPALRDRLLAYRDEVVELYEQNREFFTAEPLVMVNTEVNSGNFLIGDGNGRGNYLVDWEKAVLSTRYQDLGHFLVPTTTLWKTSTRLTRGQRREFLAAYRRELSALGAAVPDMDALDRGSSLLERTILLRALSWCFMAYYEYTRTERAIRNEDTFATIRNYLGSAECFLA